MTPAHRDRSRARARTRKAILDAAIAVLCGNPSASMADIAEAAETARSTVHRHFPERADLVKALKAHANAQLGDAALRARLQDDPGITALMRLCQEYFALGDLVVVAYADFTHRDELTSVGEMDAAFVELVERGHADGTIDPSLPAVWVQQTLWSMLYAAWLLSKSGRSSQHEALTLFLLTFERALSVNGRR